MSERYSGSVACDSAKSRYSQYRNYYREVAPTNTGVISRLLTDMTNLNNFNREILTNISNIAGVFKDQKDKINDAF